jgi:hypothetical protein
MAATVTVDAVQYEGFNRVTRSRVTLDSSYPTGGYTITPNQLGLGAIDFVLVADRLGYTFDWDYANNKLLVYQGDNTNAAAAPGIQVANATNLSAVTNVRVRATGR